MDINRAIKFIDDKGSRLENARLYFVLEAADPQLEVIQKFLKLQNVDGGFPFGMSEGNLSTVNETTVALWWMEELGMLASAPAEAAYAFLIASQQEDGSWDEPAEVARYDLPPWIQIGDLKTKLYLSAYSSYWLAVGDRLHLPAFRKALHLLLRHQENSGRFYGYIHTTWIATAVLLLAGERYARVAQSGLQFLAGNNLVEWDDSQLAWTLDCLSRGGLPKKHPFIEQCLAELVRRQKQDGSWASEDGESFAVGATIQALKVFKHYGLFDTDPS
ncbi:MAG: prenyltransferase/squalene oxidase repeat-containing protein [Acidobacteriaceae bacterium]